MCNNLDDSIDFESALFFKYASVLPSSTPSTLIWHYSGLDGLKGIINKKSEIKLWFTHADYLNDTSEGKEIESFYNKACSCLKENNEISNEFFDAIKDTRAQDIEIFARKNGNDYIPYISEYQLFICCFSLDGNSLDMWRYYSKGEPGYSLGFSSSLIDAIVNNKKHKMDKHQIIYYFKVIYSDEEKINKLQEMIRDAYKLYLDYPKEQEKVKLDRIRSYIAYNLKEYRLMFKHECFRSEHEYRIILSISQDRIKKQANIQYRPGHHGLIPYVEVCIDNATMYLSDVYLGPYQDSLYDGSTKSFLESNGFSCDVHHSQLPVRFQEVVK